MASAADAGDSPSLSKTQLAYQFLKERIVSQQFSPGFRLVLDSVAEELGTSVVPVREAIRLLQAEGFIVYERNVGARVAMIDEAQYCASMESLSILEGAATALSAPRLTSGDIQRARELNEHMRRSLDHFDPRHYTALNHEFHSLLFTPCPNPRLLGLVTAEWNRLGNLRESTFSFVPGRAKESVAEHEAILQLIENSATHEEIEQAARHHRAATLKSFLECKHGG